MNFFKIYWGIVMRLFNFIGILIFAASMMVTGAAYSEVLPTAAEQASKVRLNSANKLDQLFGELKRESNFDNTNASRISRSHSIKPAKKVRTHRSR